jgi:predicted TIM-barrel enzyme
VGRKMTARLSDLFIGPKPIIGMLHLAGAPNQFARLTEEILIYEEMGVNGAIIENYYGSAADLYIGAGLLSAWHPLNLTLGINWLPNEFELAIPLAAKTKAKFIQLDYVSGRYQGAEELPYERYKRMREEFPDVAVLGGVHPKYYHPVDGSDFAQDLRTAMQRADAIVITGEGTGMETPLEKLRYARKVVGDFPLIVGAGLNLKNVHQQLSIADGAIVGSSFKAYGETYNSIDVQSVRAMMKAVQKVRSEIG